LHQGKQIADSPVIRDPTVLHAHHINAFKMNFAMRRNDPEERAESAPVPSTQVLMNMDFATSDPGGLLAARLLAIIQSGLTD